MPSHLLMRCSWQFKDTDPKNQAVINPCFRHQFNWATLDGGTDLNGLSDDLGAALMSWSVPSTESLTIKIYDLEGTKPNYPKHVETYGGASPTVPTVGVPQQALCLSFFSGVNQPRKRGRLYIPTWLLTTSAATLANPTADTTVRTKVAALVPIFANLGGANVDWIVWSRAAQSAGRVDNWFVDEAWDIQRRRRVKSTVRDTGTTSG